MDTYYTPNDAYKKDMGSRLRKYRKQANLTQEKMAEILNVSIKHYSEVERGIIGVSVQKLLFISNYFGLSLDYLLKGETNDDYLPYPLVHAYTSCPDEKKECFLRLLENLNSLLHRDGAADAVLPTDGSNDEMQLG